MRKQPYHQYARFIAALLISIQFMQPIGASIAFAEEESAPPTVTVSESVAEVSAPVVVVNETPSPSVSETTPTVSETPPTGSEPDVSEPTPSIPENSPSLPDEPPLAESNTPEENGEVSSSLPVESDGAAANTIAESEEASGAQPEPTVTGSFGSVYDGEEPASTTPDVASLSSSDETNTVPEDTSRAQPDLTINASFGSVYDDEGSASTTSDAASTTPSDDASNPPVSSISVPMIESLSTETLGTTTSTSTTSLPEPVDSLSESEDDRTPDSDVSIVSGAAVAIANILNILNTTIVNSSGQLFFANIFDNTPAGVDLRSNGSGGLSEHQCGIFACNGASTTVQLSSDAQLDNTVRINAESGSNTILDAGNGSILTGDAFAGLNLVNFANVNIVDSQYFIVGLNAFRSLSGDIVFPSLLPFFSSPFGMASGSQINISQDALINNSIETQADTGSNSVFQADNSVISTGNARTTTNVFNEINSSLIGNESLMIMLRVQGEWTGNIVNAPSWLLLSGGGNGVYFFTPSSTGGREVGPDLPRFFSEPSLLDASSTARINNDVIVSAQTGSNTILGAEHASIDTGDAIAAANVINIANTTVIGRNWLLAVINVFGDFNGDIAFGRPDLWVGLQVEQPQTVVNGSEVTYKSTIINNGDAPATDVTLVDRHRKEYVSILSSSAPFTLDADGYPVWSIGTLNPGMATEITFRAQINGAPLGTLLTNTVTVAETETDNDLGDNSDTVSIIVNPVGYGGLGGGYAGPTIFADAQSDGSRSSYSGTGPSALSTSTNSITVERVSATTTTARMSTTTQSIRIINTSDREISSVFFTDVIKDPLGKIIKTEEWDLGTVAAHEEILLGYEVYFSNEATSGVYMLSSHITRPKTTNREFANNGSIIVNDPPPPVVIPESALDPLSAALYLPRTPGRDISDLASTTNALPILDLDQPFIGVAEASSNDLSNLAALGILGPSIKSFLAAMSALIMLLLIGSLVSRVKRIRLPIRK